MTNKQVVQENKNWSNKFTPEIMNIVDKIINVQHQKIVIEAPREDDFEKATDLIVLVSGNTRIAMRMRRYRAWSSYNNIYDLNISDNPDLNGKTELHKIVSGWCTYYFCGLADITNNKIQSWKIYDLNIFRLWLFKYLLEGHTLPKRKKNSQKESYFLPFDLRLLPSEFTIFSSENRYAVVKDSVRNHYLTGKKGLLIKKIIQNNKFLYTVNIDDFDMTFFEDELILLKEK